jgi:predicted nucleotide-binding protein
MAGRKKTPSAKSDEKSSPATARSKRSYLSQADVPGCVLDDALRVPRAIAENYAAKPASPLNVAAALEMQPNAGRFRLLSGAAIAYGVTSGGPNAPEILITPLGMRIVRPTKEGDDLLARREALLRPRVIGEFLQKYNNAPLPRADIAVNVLLEMGVPKDRADEVLDFIVQGAESVGVLKEIKGRKHVYLTGIPQSAAAEPQEHEADDAGAKDVEEEPAASPPVRSETRTPPVGTQERRVFITHGKNKALIDPIKKLLGFGELEPVVSVEKTSVSQPVPDKVMGEMRSCGAAIIHVDAEQKLIDKDASEHVVVNANVLIEIGAAMALFGRRFILLVREGVKLPSNLQGLFEVRYTGDTLDGDATIKLLEAINDIKNHPMPDRYKESGA